MRRDWIAGVVLLVFSLAYYAFALEIPRSQLSDAVGAASFPKLLAAALAVLSALLVVTGVSRKKSAGSAEKKKEQLSKDLQGFLRAGGTLALGIAFLLIVEWVGYIVAVALLLATMLIYNHMKLDWRSLILSAAGGVFFWALFKFAFSVAVPAGIWPGLFGM